VLSSYNGQQVVSAGLAYDNDVPKVLPGQPFLVPETQIPQNDRQKVVQSVYLLTSTRAIRLGPAAENHRLEESLSRALSAGLPGAVLCPDAFAADMLDRKVGSNSWDAATWQHYLRAPGSNSLGEDLSQHELGDQPVPDSQQEDLRYLMLAANLRRG